MCFLERIKSKLFDFHFIFFQRYISLHLSSNNDYGFINFFILIIIGLLAGTLSGIVGVGGGIIIIPLLMLLLGMDQVSIKGTSIAILLPPVGILVHLIIIRVEI